MSTKPDCDDTRTKVSKFKKGNIITIREDLRDDYYGDEHAVSEMITLAGRTTVITEVLDFPKGYEYHIAADPFDYFWTEEMFVESPGDKVESVYTGISWNTECEDTSGSEDKLCDNWHIKW